MAEAAVENIITKRRSRAIRHVLELVDEIVDVELKADVRKAVLDELNDLSDLALDLLDTVKCDHVTINEHYLDVLESLSEHLDRV